MQSVTQNFEGKKEIIKEKTFLLGSEDEKTPIDMEVGLHRYDVIYQLPHWLPASLELAHGFIQYNIQAIISFPWQSDETFDEIFTVGRRENMNEYPDLQLPSHSEEIKHFCCWCCESEPLITTVTLPCTGFSPGENIPITISYNNQSDVKILKTKITLKQVAKFNR